MSTPTPGFEQRDRPQMRRNRARGGPYPSLIHCRGDITPCLVVDSVNPLAATFTPYPEGGLVLNASCVRVVERARGQLYHVSPLPGPQEEIQPHTSLNVVVYTARDEPCASETPVFGSDPLRDNQVRVRLFGSVPLQPGVPGEQEVEYPTAASMGDLVAIPPPAPGVPFVTVTVPGTICVPCGTIIKDGAAPVPAFFIAHPKVIILEAEGH